MYFDVLKRIWPEWEIGKRIGGGAFGTVYEARRNEYGIENKAAIKIISIPANELAIYYEDLKKGKFDRIINYFSSY